MTDRAGCPDCAALRRRVGKLEKALKPFATFAEWFSDGRSTVHKSGPFYIVSFLDKGETVTLTINVEDFCDARRALEDRDD